MRHRIWRTFVLAVVAPLLLAAPATATPQQVSLDEVFSELGVTREPADYVVVVDTSSSMSDRGRYQRVKDGLAQLTSSLRADDRVTLVTFAGQPTVRTSFTPVGGDPDVLVKALPAVPTGEATDIGAALDAGMGVLEDPRMRARGALLLFTDGLIDTAGSSPYATPDSPGWGKLRSRAAAAQRNHQIAALAVGLASRTDAALLGKVFDDVTDVPSSQLSTYLPQVSTSVMKAAAASALKDELTMPVTASFEGTVHVTDDGQGRTTRVTLTNTSKHIPVTVSDFTLTTGDGWDVALQDTPASVDIGAGDSRTIDVTLASSTPAGQTTSIGLGGTVSSPWQQVLNRDLGLGWQGAMHSQPITLASVKSWSSRWTEFRHSAWLVPAAYGAGGALVLAAAGFVWWMTRPRLIGALTVSRNGLTVNELLLKGRRMTVSLEGRQTKAVLLPHKGSDGQVGVTVHASGDQERTDGTLFEGDSVTLGSLVLTYSTDRARMLQLIGSE